MAPYTENFLKFVCVVFEICKQMDRHTNMCIAILCFPIGAK